MIVKIIGLIIGLLVLGAEFIKICLRALAESGVRL